MLVNFAPKKKKKTLLSNPRHVLFYTFFFPFYHFYIFLQKKHTLSCFIFFFFCILAISLDTAPTVKPRSNSDSHTLQMSYTTNPTSIPACLLPESNLTLAQKATVEALYCTFLGRRPLGNHDSLDRICNLSHEETLVEIQLANRTFLRFEYLKRHVPESVTHGYNPYTGSNAAALALTRPHIAKKKGKRKKSRSQKMNLNKPLPQIKKERRPFWKLFRQ